MNDLYTSGFLNNIKLYDIPNHQMRQKIGASMIFLRNNDKSLGLYNGSRLLISKRGKQVIEAMVMFGKNIGDKVMILIMVTTP